MFTWNHGTMAYLRTYTQKSRTVSYKYGLRSRLATIRTAYDTFKPVI